jgi:phage terminase small subunit
MFPHKAPRNVCNPRQLEFCRHYVETAVGSEAARRAGYSQKNAKGIASELLRQPKIQNEVARLQLLIRPELLEKTKVSVASLLEEAEQARQVAFRHKSASAMVQSIRLKADLCGLISTKVEDVVARQALEAAQEQAAELRTAGQLLRAAALGMGLAPDSTPAQIVAAIANEALPHPDAFVLIKASSDVNS